MRRQFADWLNFQLIVRMEHNHTHADILQIINKPVTPELYQKVVGYLSREIAVGGSSSEQHIGIIGLLIQQLAATQHQRKSCQTQLTILIAHSMHQALNLKEYTTKNACQTIESIVFDMRVPIKLKLAMHESVSKWLTFLTDIELQQVESKAKYLIDDAIVSQTNPNDVIELLLMIVQQMVGNYQQLEKLVRAVHLLLGLRSLLTKIGLQDKHLDYYTQWLKTYTSLVKLIARLSADCQQSANVKQRIEILLERSELYEMGVIILKFKGVSHANNSRVMLCAQQITDCNNLGLFQLRIIYFQMLLATHRLASQIKCQTIFSQEQQRAIMDWTTIAIHCYLKQQPNLPYDINREEIKYRLQAALVDLYFHLTQDHYKNLENLIEKGFDLNQNIVISQLQPNSYEHYLFQNDTEHFLDIVEDFSSGKAQMATPKAHLSQLITSLVNKVQNFRLQFILMAKFQLQRAMCSYFSGYFDGSQNTPTIMSVQASLLMLCLFGSQLCKNQQKLIYFRRLFQVQNMVKLSQISIAMVFQLSISLDQDVITNQKQPQQYDAFDLALWTKQIPLRLAALRFLCHFCSEQYYARHVADVVQLIAQTTHESDLRELSLAWNILKKTVESHMNKMHISWLMAVLKKLIISQLLKMAYRVGCNTSVYSWTATNGIQICWIIVQNIASERLKQSILEICMQIVLLYRRVLAQQIKQQIVSLMKAICTRIIREKRDFPKQLPDTVPLLLRDISTPSGTYEPYRCQILHTLELIVVLVGRKKRPKLLRKIKPILTTISHLFSLQIQKLYHCQSDVNEKYLYGYLVIMNRLVQYFGTQIKSQHLKGWVIDCRKLQCSGRLNTLNQRISNFVFACSVYLKEAAMFATVLQTVSREKFSLLEKEIMLDTLAIFFSTCWAVGGLVKYVYLIRLLYLLTTLPIQFEPNINDRSIEGFVHKSRNLMEYEECCIQVYRLFKTYKHSLSIYLNAHIQPDIMRQFHSKQVMLKACGLLDKDTCMNYQTSKQQLELRQHYKLQLCNPLDKYEWLLEDDTVGVRIFDIQQQQRESHFEHIEHLCRKIIKQN